MKLPEIDPIENANKTIRQQDSDAPRGKSQQLSWRESSVSKKSGGFAKTHYRTATAEGDAVRQEQQ